MKVSIPGRAYEALKATDLPDNDPALWTRVLNHSASYRHGRGWAIELDLESHDLLTVRHCLDQMHRQLASQPYPVRGVEGDVTLQSVRIALCRLDDALHSPVDC